VTCSADEDYEIGPAEILVGAEQPFEISLYDYCARPWRPNEPVDLTETIRPARPNGFAAQCSAAGVTGSREPVWPKTLAAPVTDGSAAWAMVAAGTNGLNAASSPTASVSPASGLTIDSLAVSESYKLTGAYEGTVAGEYVVTYSFTVDGKVRKARQAVTVV
jgi:hypothetical protein